MTKRIVVEASPDENNEGLSPREMVALLRDCDEIEFCTFGGRVPRPQRVIIEDGRAVVRFYN